MSGINSIEIGHPVPIALSLSDGNESMYPQAEIYIDGIHTTTLDLTHIGSGYYTSATYPMTQVDSFVVIYIVYEDATHLSEAQYERDIDIFDVLTTGEYDTPLGTLQASVDALTDESGGKWEILANQMIFYKADNTTEVMRFDLFDAFGNPASANVTRRERV